MINYNFKRILLYTYFLLVISSAFTQAHLLTGKVFQKSVFPSEVQTLEFINDSIAIYSIKKTSSLYPKENDPLKNYYTWSSFFDTLFYKIYGDSVTFQSIYTSSYLEQLKVILSEDDAIIYHDWNPKNNNFPDSAQIYLFVDPFIQNYWSDFRFEIIFQNQLLYATSLPKLNSSNEIQLKFGINSLKKYDAVTQKLTFVYKGSFNGEVKKESYETTIKLGQEALERIFISLDAPLIEFGYNHLILLENKLIANRKNEMGLHFIDLGN